MTSVLIVTSSFISIVAPIPYIFGVVAGRTKPRVVSWLTFARMGCLVGAAALSDGQYPAAALALCAVLTGGLVAILGLKHGDRRFTSLDVACQAGALFGLALWVALDSPEACLVTQILVSIVAMVPTLLHCWRRPDEEKLITYALYALGGAVAVFAAVVGGAWGITAILYPTYITVMDLALCGLIVAGSSRDRAAMVSRAVPDDVA